MPEPRNVIAQPDFTQIFASAAALGELLTWPSEDYLRGWGYLQPQEAPPMEYFNAFYNGTDTKLLYLFSAANIRKNSTAYQVDDIVTSPNLNSQFWLVCTQAGTTDANEPDYSEVEANQEITDGTAKFLVTPKVSKGITVGNTEPDNPREGDLWLQTSSSKKTAELKQRTASGWSKVLIETILNAVTDSPIKTLERNTTCNVNTVYAEVTFPKGGFLICTQAGTTGASAATGFTTAEDGDEVTDGTAKFTVRYFEDLLGEGLINAVNGIAGLSDSAKLLSQLYDFATELEAQAGTNTTKPINAAGVAAAISALAGGAVIVDELLAQNGYVKFSNGLILQWGSNFSTVTAETLVDYPIAVSQVLTILCAADQTDIRDAEYAAPGTVTDTNFIAVTFALFGSTHAQPYPYYWIMVGIVQQWGYKNVTGDGGGHLLTTINFPVAYAEVCYTVNASIVVTNSDYDIDKFIVIGGITLSLFKATVDSETTDTEKTFKVNWLAIGQQQNKGYLRSLYR